jgi:phage terminase small subunit
MKKTNPHGANLNQEDPREQIFWDLFVQATIKGKPNAYACAVEAGYSKSHAENITLQEWFKERHRKLKSVERVDKAEEFFDEIQAMDIRDGKDEINPHLLRAKVDINKYLTSTQGKSRGYTPKTEIDHTTGGDKITAIGALIQEIEQK